MVPFDIRPRIRIARARSCIAFGILAFSRRHLRHEHAILPNFVILAHSAGIHAATPLTADPVKDGRGPSGTGVGAALSRHGSPACGRG